MAISDYKVEIRDLTGTLQYTYTNISQIQWVYSRLGGHFSADISTPQIVIVQTVTQHWDLRVLVDTGAGFGVRWRGYIVRADRLRGEPDIYHIGATGYATRLERTSVIGLGFPEEDGAVVFEGQDATAIAKALVDKIKPWVNIAYDATSAPNSGVVLSRIELNGSIANALRTLAEIAGMREWAIVHDVSSGNLKFHFRSPSSSIRYTGTYGGDVTTIEEGYYSQEVVNRIYLFGREGFNVVLENSNDMEDDQAGIWDDADLAFGRATTYQMAVQKFKPAYSPLSAVRLRLGKTGWTDLASSDGNMEDAGTSNYTAQPNSTDSVLSKDTNYPLAGAKSLKCRPSVTANQFGWYRDFTVTASQLYHVGLWVRSEYETVYVEIVNGSGAFGGTGSILATEILTSKYSWKYVMADVSPTGTTLGVRVSAYRTSGARPFWVDELSVILGGADVEVAIYEYVSDSNPTGTLIGKNTVSFSSIPNTPTSITIPIITAPLDITKYYTIQVKSLGVLNDSKYFLVRKDTAGTYANGYILYYNGTAWVALSGEDLWFATRLPAKQKTWGILSEVVSHSAIDNSADAVIWGNAVIASKQAEILRANLEVITGGTMMEDTLPLGKIAVNGSYFSTGLVAERITYQITDAGLKTSFELGAEMPKISKALAWIEYQLARRISSR